MKRATYRKAAICAILATTVLLFFPSPGFAQDDLSAINVFAAASLTNAMQEIVREFEKEFPCQVYLNLAGSNTLRLQIEKGAPADVYVSADALNPQALIQKGFVKADESISFLTNALVVVTRNNDHISMSALDDLPVYVTDYLSLADPETVPAGIYAKQALVSVGLWDSLKGKIAPAIDVRAALAQVEIGNARLGIVYKTDAVISKRVKTVYEIPTKFYRPIHYVVCLLADQAHRRQVRDFFNYIQGPKARGIFARYGFTPL